MKSHVFENENNFHTLLRNGQTLSFISATWLCYNALCSAAQILSPKLARALSTDE